ncbi:hypothetical protein GCM10007875_17890 [Limnobacter litoralis]|uniref:Carrier domain-containing protein n=1 Tax=Limnobacter litoralis TaxID=481366 RepID=A0ABQ5YRE5_9BURK|nr:hypothetical protein GCM10007875_17890 [Limnobacter litoralis]
MKLVAMVRETLGVPIFTQVVQPASILDIYHSLYVSHTGD